jgi:hypothetical protein
MRLGKLLVVVMMYLVVGLAGKPTTIGASDCRCTPAGGSTADYWGTGSTCSQAAASWKSQANAEASAMCWPDGVCQLGYTVNIPCYWDATEQVYKENGETRYRCYICF